MVKTSSEGSVRLQFESIRNVTSPDEKENGSRTFIVNLPAEEILKIDTEHDLRDYIPAHAGTRRNGVHMAIAATIENNPSRFITLHGGFVVSTEDVKVEDESKRFTLRKASLINGAQSQGEIRRYFESCEAEGVDPNRFYVRAEIIVEGDPEFIVETAIARNTSTQVAALSQAGKKKAFDELEKGFQKTYPQLKLRKSETDTEPEYVDTERLLQFCTALMPEELIEGTFTANKLKAYKQRGQCRASFETAAFAAMKDPHCEQAQSHGFYVDIAPYAWKEYQHWRSHPGWRGKYLQERTNAITRAEGEHTVADGIVFPILAALSLFVKKEKGHWILEKPRIFRDEMMIDAALSQLRVSCGGKVFLMGRQAGVYESLRLIPKMVLDVMTDRRS
jgi:hypothetical protein